MLLQELLKNLQDIELQQEELKRQKKKLIAKAKEERVLEVGLYDLYTELIKVEDCRKGRVSVNRINVPEKFNQDMEKAKKYILDNNVGLSITIEMDTSYDTLIVYKITTSIADARLTNGEKLIDNLVFESKTAMFPKEEIMKDLVLNFGLDNPLLQKTFFKKAVLNCVEKKENNITK